MVAARKFHSLNYRKHNAYSQSLTGTRFEFPVFGCEPLSAFCCGRPDLGSRTNLIVPPSYDIVADAKVAEYLDDIATQFAAPHVHPLRDTIPHSDYKLTLRRAYYGSPRNKQASLCARDRPLHFGEHTRCHALRHVLRRLRNGVPRERLGTAMIDVPAIHELYRYNGWANARMFEAVSNLTPEEFSRDLRSSYPSAHDTLLHIVWAEWIWLQRWKGFSPQSVWHAADYPELDALKTRWSDVTIEQRAFLDAIDRERLLSVVRYLNLQGETWQYPLWRTMYHVLNHSSYHRGQLITMLRQLGARVLPTDFLVFHDELESPPG